MMLASLYDANCWATRSISACTLSVSSLALAPVVQTDEQQALALAAAGEIEAVDLEHRLDHALFLSEQVVADIVERDRGAPLRRARRCLDLDERVALILVGQERRGQAHEKQADCGDDRRINHEPAPGTRDHMAHAAVRTGRGRSRSRG